MRVTSWLLAALVLVGAAVGRPHPPRRPLPTPASCAVMEAASGPARARRRVPARRVAAAEEAEALRALPEVVDLLAVAVAAGLPAGPAVLAVAERAPPAWGEALGAVRAALEGGERLDDAFGRLVRHHGDLARPLTGALRAALDDGDALAPALARLAVDARDLRRRRAEEAARRLPVRLLLPLVTCSLPAFAVLTVVPVLAGALVGLRLPAAP